MRFQGIEGLSGRTPVGAVLRVGIKGKSGAPTDRDRFYVCQPRMDGTKSRPLDERFAAFNNADPKYRRDVDAYLVHVNPNDSYNVSLGCYRPGGAPTAPDNRFFCVGDGRVAERWDPRADNPESPNGKGAFVQIACANDACIYRQKKHQRDGCKPNVTLLFQPQWPDGSSLPTPLMRLDSHSWNSGRNLLGFFEFLNEQIDGLMVQGVLKHRPSLYGLRFKISLREETSTVENGRRFPVLTFTPLETVSEWLLRMAQNTNTITETYAGLLSIPQEEHNSMLIEVDPYAERRIVSPAIDGGK